LPPEIQSQVYVPSHEEWNKSMTLDFQPPKGVEVADPVEFDVELDS